MATLPRIRPVRALPKGVQWPTLLLAAALVASTFANFYRLGRGEFLGEDEALVLIKITRQFLWSADLRNLGAILTSAHPPMRLILPTPFVWLLGPTELALRLPNALAGVLVCAWVYRVGHRAFNAPVGALAAMLIGVSGMNGVYRSGNGIGIFTLFLLIALEHLLAFLDATGIGDERHALMRVGFFLGLATLTFVEGVVFFLPCAGVFLYKRRRFERYALPALTLYLAILAVYVIGWIALPWIVTSTGVYPLGGGNLLHTSGRLRSLGAFNLGDLVVRTVGTCSVWMALLMVDFMPWGFPHLGTKGLVLVLFFLPHLLAWLLVLDHPSGHMTYEVPLWALLTALGVYAAFNRIGRGPALRPAIVAVSMGLLGLAGWHTYAVFLQDTIATTPSNGVFFSDLGTAAGVPPFVHLGQATAGVYIREHASSDAGVVTDFGGSLELYYAGRRPSLGSFEAVLAGIHQPANARAANVRFLVLRERTLETLKTGLKRLPACVVTVDQKPALFIYDLWQQTEVTEVWPSETYRATFYARYANTFSLRPFITENSGA